MRRLASSIRSAMRRLSPKILMSFTPSSFSPIDGPAEGAACRLKRILSRSPCCTTDPAPLPATPARSIPSAAARARTAGDAKPLAPGLACLKISPSPLRGGARGGGRSGLSGNSSASPPSTSNTTNSEPTAALLPSSPLRDTMRPATGDTISTVALSVMMSTSGCSSPISSPGFTCHLMISASAVPSPTSGSLKTKRLMATHLRHSGESRNPALTWTPAFAGVTDEAEQKSCYPAMILRIASATRDGPGKYSHSNSCG